MFVDEGTIDEVVGPSQVILKAAETKVTGVSKRAVAKKKARKKAKKTTRFLAHVSREGLTSQLAED